MQCNVIIAGDSLHILDSVVNTSNVPDCIRFATWNIGTMAGRSAEVVKTLHRRKIDVRCV